MAVAAGAVAPAVGEAAQIPALVAEASGLAGGAVLAVAAPRETGDCDEKNLAAKIGVQF